MESNNLEGRSRSSSFRRRALTLVGATALTLSGAGAAVFGASQAFAAAVSATGPSFNIGTTVSNLSLADSSTTAGGTGVTVSVGFTATTAVAASGTITIDNLLIASSPTPTVVLTDGSNSQTITPTLASGTTTGTEKVSLSLGSASSNAIKAGDTVSIKLIGATNAAAGTYSASVSTSGDLGVVTSNSITLSTSVGVVGSLSSQTPGASNVIMSVSGVSAPSGGLVAGSNVILLSDSGAYNTSPVNSTGFPTTPSSYKVTDTTSGASQTVTGTVTAATITASSKSVTNFVYFTSPISASAGDSLTVTATGVVNDSNAQAQTLQVVGLGASPTIPTSAVVSGSGSAAASSTAPQLVGATSTVAAYWSTSTTGTSPNLVYTDAGGDVTSAATTTGSAVTGVSVSLSNAVASQSNVTYTVSFTATSAATSFTVSGFTLGSTNVVTDTTASANVSYTLSSSTFTATITKGHSYTLTSYGVTNGSTAGAQKVTVYTSADNIPVTAAFTLSSATTVGPFVSLSDSTPGATSNWKINGFEAKTALPVGDTIALTTTPGFNGTFPSAVSDYSVTDLTTSSGTATPTSVTTSSTTATITLANAITAGDNLQIVINGVINSSGGAYTATLTPGGSSDVLIGVAATPAPAPSAPNAATTGSSGALVNVSGTIYVYVGGVAFGIPTPAAFNTISAGLGNPTVVSATSVTTSGTVASGSLVQVVGSPQINVVGSNNTYYGFSTPSQFLSDGYSFANVIQIPSFGSLTAGTGTAPAASATMANGALVNVSGTIYVYAGGVAQGIPTPAVFNTISAALGNPTVVSATSVTTTGNMAAGTLVQVVGSPQINVVTSTGTQVGFATASEFTGDGYSFAKVIPIP